MNIKIINDLCGEGQKYFEFFIAKSEQGCYLSILCRDCGEEIVNNKTKLPKPHEVINGYHPLCETLDIHLRNCAFTCYGEKE